LKKLSMPNLHVALVHYPVVGKNGKTIASAVTNLDLHDISRAARTYGVRSFFVVTPIEDQKELVDKIVSHWVSGAGSRYNPKRCEALSLIRVKETFGDVLADIALHGYGCPKTVVTSAKKRSPTLGFSKLKALMLENETPYVLTFGTAWGLTEDFIENADYVLEPLVGCTDYNHLPVRSAAAVILDRLVGRV
jgi:hypothetical protein